MDRRLTRLYASNVRSRSGSKESKDLFSEVGKLAAYEVQNGQGFLEYESTDDAATAVKKFNGFKFGGDKIQIEYAMKSTNKFIERKKVQKDEKHHNESRYYIDRAERQKYMQSGRCFKCKERGHIAKNCKSDEQSRSRSRSQSFSDESRSRSKSRSRSHSHKKKSRHGEKKKYKSHKSNNRDDRDSKSRSGSPRSRKR